MSELKPCPFCGKVLNTYAIGPHSVPWYVRCNECGTHGPYKATKVEAIAAWNQRLEASEGCPRCVMHWVSDVYSMPGGYYVGILHMGGGRLKFTTTRPKPSGEPTERPNSFVSGGFDVFGSGLTHEDICAAVDAGEVESDRILIYTHQLRGAGSAAALVHIEDIRRRLPGEEWVPEIHSLLNTLEAEVGRRAPSGEDFTALLPPHKCGLYLTHNEHRGYYESVEKWDELRGQGDWVSNEERQRAIETDEVWGLQWYPDTPAGFYRILGASLNAVLRAAAPEHGEEADDG